MISSSSYNLCQSEIEQAARMWKAGKDTFDIAAKLGVHQACVARAIPQIIKFIRLGSVRVA